MIINRKSKFRINKTKDEALNLLKKINFKGWNLISYSNDTLIYKISISFRSWGEKVEIKIFDKNKISSVIEISSKPILFTTLFDYGKSDDNINKIKDLLEVDY